MPVTGADLTLFAVTGVALVATGTVIVRRTRARREASEA
jgi:LPXTG-motif cell wall-anchored protein